MKRKCFLSENNFYGNRDSVIDKFSDIMKSSATLLFYTRLIAISDTNAKLFYLEGLSDSILNILNCYTMKHGVSWNKQWFCKKGGVKWESQLEFKS